MSNVDLAKEQIAYLKLWLGIAIATALSLGGWLAGHLGSAPWLQVFGALAAFVMVLFGILTLHRRIEDKIRRLEDL